MLEGKEVFVRASIGIAVADGRTTRRSTTSRRCCATPTSRCTWPRRTARTATRCSSPRCTRPRCKRLELKADLQRALEHDEFILHYQPVIELETGRISGVEALIRWIHPERGMVPPLDFIPLAEETGLIVPIGRWVLQEACAYAAELHERFPTEPPLHMAVNLSARQVARPEIVDDVRAILAETGLDAERADPGDHRVA